MLLFLITKPIKRDKKLDLFFLLLFFLNSFSFFSLANRGHRVETGKKHFIKKSDFFYRWNRGNLIP